MYLSTGYKVTSSPAVEPVTLAEAKVQCRVVDTSEDSLITALIVAARQHCENYLNFALIDQQITAKFAAFPIGARSIQLPMSQLRSVTSVSYVDSDGAAQTFSSANYLADTFSNPGNIYLVAGIEWPTSVASQNSAVSVVYQAGLSANAAGVPQSIKQAMLLLIGHWFENRESVIVGTTASAVPMTVEALLNPYRLLGV